MKKNDIVVMIPARMGSKRIPKKNVRFLLDKPLIQYPIELALKNDKIKSVWVNTESEELGIACEKMGVNFHRRPAELATDTATNREFTYEFLKKHKCEYLIMLNPTSPTLKERTFDEFISYVCENDFDTVLSVVSYKAESFFKGEKVNFDGQDKINSQYLDPIDVVVWAMTAWRRDTFIKLQESGECPVFGGRVGTFTIPKDESADLDTEEDWNIAEATLMARKMKLNKSAKYLI